MIACLAANGANAIYPVVSCAHFVAYHASTVLVIVDARCVALGANAIVVGVVAFATSNKRCN